MDIFKTTKKMRAFSNSIKRSSIDSEASDLVWVFVSAISQYLEINKDYLSVDDVNTINNFCNGFRNPPHNLISMKKYHFHYYGRFTVNINKAICAMVSAIL